MVVLKKMIRLVKMFELGLWDLMFITDCPSNPVRGTWSVEPRPWNPAFVVVFPKSEDVNVSLFQYQYAGLFQVFTLRVHQTRDKPDHIQTDGVSMYQYWTVFGLRYDLE